jgi:hypothetical protein
VDTELGGLALCLFEGTCFAYNFLRQSSGNAVYATDDFDYAKVAILLEAKRSKAKISRKSLSKPQKRDKPLSRRLAARKRFAVGDHVMAWLASAVAPPGVARCASTRLCSTNSWLAATKSIGRGMPGRSRSDNVFRTP